MKFLHLLWTILLLLICLVQVSSAEYSFRFYCDEPAMIGYPDSLNGYVAPLINTGDDDTLALKLMHNFDPGWTAFICINELCFGDTVNWAMNSGDSSTVMPDIAPGGNVGEGWFSIKINSVGNPSVADTLDFFFAAGYSTVVVNGDPNDDYAEYYVDALNENGIMCHTWPRWYTPLTTDAMDMLDMLYWFTGDAATTLTTEDFAILSDYLDARSDFFISGQGIAEDLQDSSFFQDYLHAAFDGVTESREVEGIDSDTLSDGFSFDIEGSGGADNQTAPASLSILNWFATPTFMYGDGGVAGIKYSYHTHQIVYLSFGFEAINDSQTRADLMEAVSDYFELETDTSTVGVDDPEDTPELPEILRLAKSYPNPFNAATNIEINVPNPQHVDIAVYDLNGRMVERLHDGYMDAGTHVLRWDASNAASGIYHCKIAGGDSESLPLMLVK